MRFAPRAEAQRDQGEGIDLAAGFQILIRLEFLQGIRGSLVPGPGGVLRRQKALGGQGSLDLAVTVRGGRQLPVAPGDGAFDRGLLAAASALGGGPGLRAETVPRPFLLEEAIPDFLAGAAFFLAAVFLAGAFCTAVAPSALQASRIIAAMAAQLKIFIMGTIVSVSIP